MRLFIAIPLPVDVRDALATAVTALQNEQPPVVPPSAFKWVRPENLHVTVKFLGDVPADRLEPVMAACRRAAGSSKPASLAVTSLALHPPSRAARLIVGQMQGEVEAVASLAGRLEEELLTLGFPKEGRPFWPHVTIARARVPIRLSIASRTRWDRVASTRCMPRPTFTANAIELIESRLLPAGPVYTVVGAFPVGGGAMGLRAMT